MAFFLMFDVFIRAICEWRDAPPHRLFSIVKLLVKINTQLHHYNFLFSLLRYRYHWRGKTVSRESTWKDQEITILNFNYGMCRLRIFFCVVTVVYYFFLGEIEKDSRLSCLPLNIFNLIIHIISVFIKCVLIGKACVFNLIKLIEK